MKAALNAPSAKSARNMLGRRKATKKASEAKLAPMKVVCSVSRTSASTRLTKVRPPTDPSERTRFMPSALVRRALSTPTPFRPGPSFDTRLRQAQPLLRMNGKAEFAHPE
jgi:hypothetical protein